MQAGRRAAIGETGTVLRVERQANAGIVMRAAWRTSGSARQQPQETEERSTSLLPRTSPVPQSQIVGQEACGRSPFEPALFLLAWEKL